jgi:hypothetical protein
MDGAAKYGRVVPAGIVDVTHRPDVNSDPVLPQPISNPLRHPWAEPCAVAYPISTTMAITFRRPLSHIQDFAGAHTGD